MSNNVNETNMIDHIGEKNIVTSTDAMEALEITESNVDMNVNNLLTFVSTNCEDSEKLVEQINCDVSNFVEKLQYSNPENDNDPIDVDEFVFNISKSGIEISEEDFVKISLLTKKDIKLFFELLVSLIMKWLVCSYTENPSNVSNFNIEEELSKADPKISPILKKIFEDYQSKTG